MSTVLTNGRFFTGGDAALTNPSDVRKQCMIIQDDQITYMGDTSNATVEQATKHGASEIDLNGQLVVPGFIDAHCHISQFGASLDKIDLRYCNNLEAIRGTISDHASRNPSASMLLCRGWIQDTTDGAALASMLDGLDSRPIFIEANDLHSTWCNTAALEAMALDGTPDPEGGKIHRDESGKPSGLLSEGAQVEIVWPFIAQSLSREERISNVRRAMQAYVSAGYTGLVDMAMDEADWDILQELDSLGQLQCWIRAYWIIKPRAKTEDNIAQVDRAIELNQHFSDKTSPNLRVVGIKLVCDGVIDSCTASLMEPYSVDGSSCDSIWSEEMLAPVLKYADSAGLQCAFHAIGDRTIKTVVDTIEKHATPGKRHRIEHLELTRPEDAQRLGKLGITASVQPVHSDPAILAAWPKLLGSKRCKRAFAYKEFTDHGATLAIGTDAPTAPHLALDNLYIATTRRSAKDPHMNARTNEEFALSLAAAFTAATKGAAYSCFIEDRVGELKPGRRADFSVIEFAGQAENLMKGRVLETWSRGRPTFKSR